MSRFSLQWILKQVTANTTQIHEFGYFGLISITTITMCMQIAHELVQCNWANKVNRYNWQEMPVPYGLWSYYTLVQYNTFRTEQHQTCKNENEWIKTKWKRFLNLHNALWQLNRLEKLTNSILQTPTKCLNMLKYSKSVFNWCLFHVA